MKESSKIFVAGHRGLVGSAIVRRLETGGYRNLVVRQRSDLDLTNQAAVNDFFLDADIEYVFLAAAKVGGIIANKTQQANFLYENLMIAANVIHAAHVYGVKKLLFLGSSCVYPKMAPQPLEENSLLTGPLEPTNEGYAIAKITGLKLCEYYHRQFGRNFISAMPTNLYGPGDNFHPTNSHVIPGMMRRFHAAKVAGSEAVTIWGTGKPLREFLHVDDLAAALLVLMKDYASPETINIGTGKDISIAELASLMAEVVGFEGELIFDASKPDGTPRKQLDVSRLAKLGWQAEISLKQGLVDTYRWALEQKIFS